VAGDGAREFLLWALERYEVRWLTFWATTGEMDLVRAHSLAGILGVDVERILSIRGLDFSEHLDKQDGIDWVEVRKGRPFIWVEDANYVGDNLRERLERKGLLDRWIACDVTNDKDALKRIHRALEEQWQSPSETEPTAAANVLVEVARLREAHGWAIASLHVEAGGSGRRAPPV
jgi:hypothetical protein